MGLLRGDPVVIDFADAVARLKTDASAENKDDLPYRIVYESERHAHVYERESGVLLVRIDPSIVHPHVVGQMLIPPYFKSSFRTVEAAARTMFVVARLFEP